MSLGSNVVNALPKLQYKLWAEALDIGKHQSKEDPPRGPIWGEQKPTKSKKGTNSDVKHCNQHVRYSQYNLQWSLYKNPW